MMPVTALSNLSSAAARTIELGPFDYQRKLGEAMPPSSHAPGPCRGALAVARTLERTG